MPLCPTAIMETTCNCNGISSSVCTYSPEGIPVAVKRSRTCIQQLPNPKSSACNWIIMEAIAASSIQTSLANGSAITTTAIAASARKAAPISLQWESFSSISLSSTTRNCQQLLRLEDGAIKAAFNKATTSSCVNS